MCFSKSILRFEKTTQLLATKCWRPNPASVPCLFLLHFTTKLFQFLGMNWPNFVPPLKVAFNLGETFSKRYETPLFQVTFFWGTRGWSKHSKTTNWSVKNNTNCVVLYQATNKHQLLAILNPTFEKETYETFHHGVTLPSNFRGRSKSEQKKLVFSVGINCSPSTSNHLRSELFFFENCYLQQSTPSI